MTGSIEVVRLWAPAFFAELRVAGCVTHACQAADISRNHAYRMRLENPEFARQWEEALAGYSDDLKAEAVRRAVHGVQEAVLFQGTPVFLYELDGRIVPAGTANAVPRALMKSRYSDAILLRMLEAALPADAAAANSPAVAAAVLGDLRNMTDEELDARIAELERGEEAPDGGEESAEGGDGGPADGGEGPPAVG